MRETILIVDDDEDIVTFLRYNLEKEGYNVLSAVSGNAGLALAKAHVPDLILLDVMMNDLDGIETCYAIREEEKLNDTVIVMLSARGEDFTQIAAYKAGTDDFIQKPIKPQLLITKLEAILKRRHAGSSSASDENQSFVIYKDQFCISIDGERIDLPKKEFEIILLLHSYPNRVFSREEIYLKIWKSEFNHGDRTIDVHIKKLRSKIGEEIIRTVKGVGYQLTIG